MTTSTPTRPRPRPPLTKSAESSPGSNRPPGAGRSGRSGRPPELTRRQRRRRRLRRILFEILFVLKYLFIAAVGFATAIACLVLNFKIAPPDTSALMRDAAPGNAMDYMDLEYMNRYLLVALIGQEDQEFMTRSGPVDMDVFMSRATAFLHGEADTSGSTIPQQVAKNLFLNESYSPLRKGEELVLAYGVTTLLSKHDIVELYLNYAQFGSGLFGVCDAYWYYFNHAPNSSDYVEAASLIGLLPSPGHVRRAYGPNGGLDFQPFIDAYNADPAGNPYNLNSYNNSRDGTYDYPRWQDNDLGGMHRVDQLLGVDDAAHDNPDVDQATDCSEMPPEVRQRLITEEYMTPDGVFL